jgi:nucleotidyltransferase substrate binding protein (TIGR01987 family)
MEKVKSAYDITLQTLATLGEALELLQEKDIPPKYYLSFCDSVIQRFEYSIDNFWKFIKIYMTGILKVTIDANAPKAIMPAAHDANIITEKEFEMLVKAITRRNETSHAYNKN